MGVATCPECHPAFPLEQLGETPLDPCDPEPSEGAEKMLVYGLTVVVGELQIVEMRGQEVLEGLVSAGVRGQLHYAVLLAVQHLHVVVWGGSKWPCSSGSVKNSEKVCKQPALPVMDWKRSALYSM